MPLGDVALVNLIADGIATAGNEQTEEYLRAGVLAVLREAAFAQVILLCGLKIQRGHVIEADGYAVAGHLLGIRVCDVLNKGLEISRPGLGWGCGLAFSRCDFGLAAITVFLLFFLAVAQVIKETVYLVNAVRHMQVALHIVHSLQFAARVE